MAQAAVTIVNVTATTVSEKSGYDTSIIDFTVNADCDAYELRASKDTQIEILESIAVIWPKEYLFPNEESIPIDFIIPDNTIFQIDITGQELDFGDGEYDIELVARTVASRGDW